MNGFGLRTFALTCSCLLVVSLSSFARTNGEIPTYSNQEAMAASSEVPALWRRALALPADPAQSDASQPATVLPSNTGGSYSQNVQELLLQDMAFSLDQAQGSAPQQTKPAPGNQPSLQGLGFPANEIKGSAKEQALLEKRSHMLQIHQKLGLLTAIPMIAAVFTGPSAKGHHGLPGSPTSRDVHMGLGILTTGMYWSSAYFAIRAPKLPDEKSYGLIRLHKAMVWIHGPGMILTPILGAIAYSQLSRGERVHGIAKYHAWAAYTTTAAYGVAILSVTLK